MNNTLKEIAERYQSDSFFRRMRKMSQGIRQPKESKEYKEALIEGQRLSAPASAVIFPLMALLLLFMLTGSLPKDKTIQIVKWIPEVEPVVLTDPHKLENTDQSESVGPEAPSMGNIDFKPSIMDVEPQPQAVLDNQSEFVLPNFKTGPTFTSLASGISDGRGDGVDARSQTDTEDAVLKALRWLKKTQGADGSWNQNKSAMTGLAILTFLAHDERPGKSEEFGDAVQRAIEFLMAGQDRTTGLFANQDQHCYSQPIAAYAMCEAYGMTLNPNVKESAELALLAIIKGQHPTGGWTYKMDPSVDPATGKYRDDTSYMGWCAQALKAAKLAGLKVEGLDRAAKLAVKGFKGNAGENGGFGYTSKSGTHGLTSVGALCMGILGAGEDKAVRNSLAIMDRWRIGPYAAENKVGENPQYYFYYATQSKFNFGGTGWKHWESEMRTSYIPSQHVQQSAIKDHKGVDRDIGWWENGDKHSDRPVMDTCLTALQLMVYYRNLPTTMAEAFRADPEIIVTLQTDSKEITVDYPENL